MISARRCIKWEGASRDEIRLSGAEPFIGRSPTIISVGINPCSDKHKLTNAEDLQLGSLYVLNMFLMYNYAYLQVIIDKFEF